MKIMAKIAVSLSLGLSLGLSSMVAVAAEPAAAPAASAVPADMRKLAEEKSCFTCHQLKAKSYGPAYREVARKYKNVANADVMLADKIKIGGTGHWGNGVMPPSPARVEVSDQEAEELAQWVLQQYK